MRCQHSPSLAVPSEQQQVDADRTRIVHVARQERAVVPEDCACLPDVIRHRLAIRSGVMDPWGIWRQLRTGQGPRAAVWDSLAPPGRTLLRLLVCHAPRSSALGLLGAVSRCRVAGRAGIPYGAMSSGELGETRVRALRPVASTRLFHRFRQRFRDQSAISGRSWQLSRSTVFSAGKRRWKGLRRLECCGVFEAIP